MVNKHGKNWSDLDRIFMGHSFVDAYREPPCLRIVLNCVLGGTYANAEKRSGMGAILRHDEDWSMESTPKCCWISAGA